MPRTQYSLAIDALIDRIVPTMDPEGWRQLADVLRTEGVGLLAAAMDQAGSAKVYRFGFARKPEGKFCSCGVARLRIRNGIPHKHGCPEAK